MRAKTHFKNAQCNNELDKQTSELRKTCTQLKLRKVFRIGTTDLIGTVRYNWPMSAHASQAFSIAHCTDSEDLPRRHSTGAYNKHGKPNYRTLNYGPRHACIINVMALSAKTIPKAVPVTSLMPITLSTSKQLLQFIYTMLCKHTITELANVNSVHATSVYP